MSKLSKNDAYQQHSLLNRAEEACKLLKKHLDQDHVVRIISHNDADGISAAGIVCNAITKEKGKFHVTIVPRLKEEILNKISREKYKLFFFCDMGSAWIDKIGRLKGDAIVADHHQTIDSSGDNQETLVHLNPHLFGMDGTRDVSASGVSYLAVRPLENYNLSGLALVGAFGDMQCNDNITGVNQTILQDGMDRGVLDIREGLKISSQFPEPIYKALAYSFTPALPGISGDPEGSRAFLEKIGIAYGIKFHDLSNEEKDILKEELVKVNPTIFSKIYRITGEIPELRNIADYARIIDACGKSKNYGVGLSICLGDRDDSVKEGMELLKKYQDGLLNGLNWIKKEGSREMAHIQYIYTEDKNIKSFLGTLSSIGLDLTILNPDKPVLAISRMDNLVKVSARTTLKITQTGVNLGVALKESSNSFGGAGGGHTVAAGAVVPYKNMDNFLNLVDDMVKSQINAQ
jgi:single-stranded-DNA-specific exonuclease